MCPQLCPGRAQGSWQALPESFTVPCCCLLLVHPLQTPLTCFFHLSFSPFLQNSEVDLPRCAGSSPSSSHVCPTTWNQPGPPKLPLSHPACSLPVPSFVTCPCATARGAAGAPWHHWHIGAMKLQSILADPSPSPLLLLPSCTHFAPLRLLLLCISQLLGCSLSFLWAVTSSRMKHWCLSKGEILESHFLSKHSC